MPFSENKEKISRICWNEYGWRRPSGRSGKSQDEKSYEYIKGFGHEEWLFDVQKTIDGKHYGYLQSVARGIREHARKKYNISFYAIDSRGPKRWWLGKALDVEVISEAEAKEVSKKYYAYGWMDEMNEQLKAAGVLEKEFKKNSGYSLVNIKFNPEHLQLLNEPVLFSAADSAVPTARYSFLDFEKIPEPLISINGNFKFMPGRHGSRKKTTTASRKREILKIDLLHNRMQDAIFNQAVNLFGAKNVASNHDTGFGTLVDIVVKDQRGFIFYEIKTQNILKQCFREAIGQLFEYAYYPSLVNAYKLVIVSQNSIDEPAQRYLKHLRDNFNLSVFYQQFCVNRNELIKQEY